MYLLIHLPPTFHVQIYSSLHYPLPIYSFVHPLFIYPFFSLIPCIYAFILYPYNTHLPIFPLFVYPLTHLLIHCPSIHSSTNYSLICPLFHPSFFHTSHNYPSVYHLSILYIYPFIYCPSIHASIHPSIHHFSSSIKLSSIH